ncbi:MAG: dTDP-4-dehydrorhamnose 3,5-epimerase [Flavobacteriales bacterium]|nr:dTDP-4-dehydrorhamnose 3,5-epimerase [Flavobacteriales bacterium]
MKFIPTQIENLTIIESTVFADSRGYFMEGFNKQKLKHLGLDINVIQTNISESSKNVVRGLHFQNPPFAQGKLIRVLKGAVLDVAVDLRKDSKTYGQHFSIELSEKNKLALWIPTGFAHGFATLMDKTLFYYDCTETYNKESEGSLRWNDPILNINWGIESPILSEKDAMAPLFVNFKSQF